MTTLLSFIIVLGLLIFVHELGHFLFAKMFGVRVLKFSLGFGPKVFGRHIGETEYVISAFPLGGYVKMFGENPDEQDVSASDRSVAYAHKSPGRRFLIVFAGPFFNLVFPIVLFFFLFSFAGVPEPMNTTKIGEVAADSPAMRAGIEKGDSIYAIDGVPTKQWVDVLNGVKKSDGKAIRITVQRGDALVDLTVQPKIDSARNLFGEVVEERYMVGIVKDNSVQYTAVGIFEAFSEAIKQTWYFIYLTVLGFIKIIQQVVPASEIGGPILIAKIAGEQMREGLINLTYFIALLSVNLGILNLLPVPVLDGGHLVFISVEAIRKKPLSEKAQIALQKVGLALLGALMLFAFYNDIMRWFR